MAKSVDSEGRKTIRMQVNQGPNLHAIEHSLCSPNDSFWDNHVVSFTLSLPRDEDGDGDFRSRPFMLYLVLVEFKRLDVDRCVLGGHLKDDVQYRRVDLHKKAPFQIYVYSVKSRLGQLKVDYDTYCRLVKMIDGVGS